MTTSAEGLPAAFGAPLSISGVRLTGESFPIVSKATVTVVDVDSGAEEKITVSSPGAATGLNLKENQRIYFGGLPSIANYRYVWF